MLGTGVYSDWYLPSVAELKHIWNNFYEVQKALANDQNPNTTPLKKDYYWSSTEHEVKKAYTVSFHQGQMDNYWFPKDRRRPVRAVRAF
ncbi:hypothetical protein MASR2M117_18290 [Paludibacter sp.]